MKHTLVTFIAEIDSARQGALDKILENLALDPARNSLLPFGDMPSIHFASVSIFVNELDNAQNTLVFEINGDGPVETLLRELWEKGKDGLHAIFSCCQGYSASGKGFAPMREFLLARLQKPAAWHIGNVGLSAKRIHQEEQLRFCIESHLDSLRFNSELPANPERVRDAILAIVRQKHPWALQSEARQTRLERLLPVWRLRAFVVALLGVFLWGWRATIPGLIFVVGLLRWHEMRDAREVMPRVEFARQAAQEAEENPQGQNHLSSLIRVQPGLFRRILLRFVLFVVNLVARTSTRGELGGIPSIHFAHWSLVDGGRRLLFVSNYDNSWGSYLDDFTDKASGGLTAIWSNTRWFPPTRFLVKDGARSGARFKRWARLSQEPVRLWYQAYPHLSVANIERNSAIRQGLAHPLRGEELTAWLQLF